MCLRETTLESLVAVALQRTLALAGSKHVETFDSRRRTSMTRFALIAAIVVILGCNNPAQSPVPQKDIELSATVQSYSAAMEDPMGRYDHLALTINRCGQSACPSHLAQSLCNL